MVVTETMNKTHGCRRTKTCRVRVPAHLSHTGETRPYGNRRETHAQTTGQSFSIACNDHLALHVDMKYVRQWSGVEVKFNLLAGVAILDSLSIVVFDGLN